MREQEVRELYEAYMQVHSQVEEVEQLDEYDTFDAILEKIVVGVSKYLEPDMKKRGENNEKAIEDMKKTKAHKDMVATARKKFDEEVETDVFTQVLEHLVAEGYADTNEAAIAIMANMSEDWRQSIVENRGMSYSGGKPGASGDGSKPKGITGGKTYQMPGFDDDSTKKPKLKGV